MLNPSLRRLMRHIALGAPLVLGAPLIGCDGDAGMSDASTVDANTSDAGTDSGWVRRPCEDDSFTLYRDRLVPDAGAPDAGVMDGGMLDGGAVDGGTPDADVADAGAPDAGAPDAGPTDCWTLCQENLVSGPGPGSFGANLVGCVDVDANEIECQTQTCFAAGRPPFEGVAGSVEGRGTSRFFRELATAELASAPAFTQLAAALEAHGAPADLVLRALESADDEVRHAAIAARLGELDRVTVKTVEPAVPSLWELAVHNAETGCVGEAYGALEAAYMASHAERADVRDAFATIARDEARHAMLSLDIDAWVRPLLGAAERTALDEATRRARAELPGKLAERHTPSELGLPGPEARAALLTQLAA